MDPLEWEIRARGTFEQIVEFAQEQKSYRRLISGLPTGYELTDISPFSPSTAIYFMDGQSAATIRLRDSGEKITFRFIDKNTSISASEPLLYGEEVLDKGIYLAAPEPLKPIAYFPKSLPDRYQRHTTLHLLQVVSMNMRDENTDSRLLIGLPYAEKYPELFFRSNLFEDGAKNASSYGVVSSLTDFVEPVTGRKAVESNGYPARSSFAVFHILETRVGTFFNKRPTVMELQPDPNGKLALRLPPIPFHYELINAPIPLYDVNKPDGPQVAEVLMAHHPEAPGLVTAARAATAEAWPWHQADLQAIDSKLASLNLRR